MSGIVIRNAVQNTRNAPSIQEGNIADRPAALLAGRLYVSWDESPNMWYRDNGVAWVPVGSTGGGGTQDFQSVLDNGNVATYATSDVFFSLINSDDSEQLGFRAGNDGVEMFGSSVLVNSVSGRASFAAGKHLLDGDGSFSLADGTVVAGGSGGFRVQYVGSDNSLDYDVNTGLLQNNSLDRGALASAARLVVSNTTTDARFNYEVETNLMFLQNDAGGIMAQISGDDGSASFSNALNNFQGNGVFILADGLVTGDPVGLFDVTLSGKSFSIDVEANCSLQFVGNNSSDNSSVYIGNTDDAKALQYVNDFNNFTLHDAAGDATVLLRGSDGGFKFTNAGLDSNVELNMSTRVLALYTDAGIGSDDSFEFRVLNNADTAQFVYEQKFNRMIVAASSGTNQFQVLGEEGTISFEGSTTAAPATTAAALPAVYYGTNTAVLATPADWIYIYVNGVARKIPCYS